MNLRSSVKIILVVFVVTYVLSASSTLVKLFMRFRTNGYSLRKVRLRNRDLSGSLFVIETLRSVPEGLPRSVDDCFPRAIERTYRKQSPRVLRSGTKANLPARIQCTLDEPYIGIIRRELLCHFRRAIGHLTSSFAICARSLPLCIRNLIRFE